MRRRRRVGDHGGWRECSRARADSTASAERSSDGVEQVRCGTALEPALSGRRRQTAPDYAWRRGRDEGDDDRARLRRAVARARALARRAARRSHGLMERGAYGRLTSVIPPITVPAWSCMMSSRTPGDLGVYGFRNRSDHTYDGSVHRRLRRRSRRLGCGTSSAARAARRSCSACRARTRRARCDGVMVSCFLTPSVESQYTYPPGLRDEIAETSSASTSSTARTSAPRTRTTCCARSTR